MTNKNIHERVALSARSGPDPKHGSSLYNALTDHGNFTDWLGTMLTERLLQDYSIEAHDFWSPYANVLSGNIFEDNKVIRVVADGGWTKSEAGRFREYVLADGGRTYRGAHYGAAMTVTREMIMLDRFDQIQKALDVIRNDGERLLSEQVADMINLNLDQEGEVIFGNAVTDFVFGDVTFDNLSAAATDLTAISSGSYENFKLSLQNATLLMRAMEDYRGDSEGRRRMGLNPWGLTTHPELEFVVRDAMGAALHAGQTGRSNMAGFISNITIHGLIDDVSTDSLYGTYYLHADPAQIKPLEVKFGLDKNGSPLTKPADFVITEIEPLEALTGGNVLVPRRISYETEMAWGSAWVDKRGIVKVTGT